MLYRYTDTVHSLNMKVFFLTLSVVECLFSSSRPISQSDLAKTRSHALHPRKR